VNSEAPRSGSIRNLLRTNPRTTPSPPKTMNDHRHP
jgi:hypothetical protein